MRKEGKQAMPATKKTETKWSFTGEGTGNEKIDRCIVLYKYIFFYNITHAFIRIYMK